MRAKLVGVTVLAAIVLLVVTVLALNQPGSEPDGHQVRGGRVAGPDTPAALLDELSARFDAKHPGRGVADYPGTTVEDIPKSYAMIVLADLERRRHGIRPDLPDLVEPAGRWLLDNATLAEDGTVGWGLPVAWDAYGDGSENPAGTVYAISTGIAVDALLSWMEGDPEAPHEEILETVAAALDNFARAPRTPDGLIPYSLEASDQPYDTFNPAAYVAGQMQRFAKYADRDLARRLTASADASVDSLVRNHRRSPEGHWYWRYSVQERNANDMPHASYIIDGLRTYVREKGALAARVDLPRVVGHLEEFVDDAGAPRAWPALQEDIDRPPRLYDVGMALSLACSEPAIASVADTLLPTIGSYRAPDGSGFLKFPVGTPDQDALVVNEYEAYLWRGIVACLVDDLSRGEQNATDEGPGDLRSSVTPAVRRTVPFVRVDAGAGKGEVAFADGQSTLRLPWSPGRRVVEDGVVLRAVDDSAGGALLVRGFPSNDLRLVTLDGRGERVDDLPLQISGGSAPMLRAAGFHHGVLNVVVYDNPTLANYLLRLERGPSGYASVGAPLRLPSFEDPSGGTYEMVPPVFLVPDGDDVGVVAGTLSATVGEEGALTEARLPNCLRAVEAVATPRGPVVLCQQVEEGGPGAPFELLGPQGVDLPTIDGDGVPFGVAFDDGRVTLRFADTPRALAKMLRADLERTDAGWLEYGTDNVEGRIAWSQIYYLNGFLDFLVLADEDPRWSELSGVLGEMRARLDQELVLADRQWREGGYKTRAFTVDRSRALFAVQTSRLLLLEQRYADEVARPVPLSGRTRLRSAVGALSGHIEVRRVSGQQPWWWPSGEPYLAWPKGSAFSFDGLNVPYNHQNEWAYAVARAGEGGRRDASAIVSQFLRRVAPDGRLPLRGAWDYWWGQAYDGWTDDDDVSTNTSAYDGDHISAAKSFRSIDAMSALALAPTLDATTRAHLRSSAATLVEQDHLYPFVGYELLRAGVRPRLPQEVARRYLRVSSPWEVQNAAWAYAAELARLAS